MKPPILTLLVFLLLASPLMGGYAQTGSARKYPGELPRYEFYATAKWKSLEPLVSTMADVRRLLGDPTDARDVSQYTKPYPGDAAAKEPVFTYDDVDNDWEILIYFVRYCFYDGPAVPASLGDRLCTIDLLPKKRIAFDKIEFPTAFKKHHVTAVDAAWDEYSDGSGLVYQVYTTRTPYGNKQPGDLFRITYGPSLETLSRYARKQ
jgi:hypothetical protein